MVRAQTLVFLGVDVPLCLTRRPATLVEIEFSTNALDEAQLIVGIQDLKILRQPGFTPVRLEQAVGEAMEGAHPHPLCADSEHLLDAGAHLAGSFIGERDGENRPG